MKKSRIKSAECDPRLQIHTKINQIFKKEGSIKMLGKSPPFAKKKIQYGKAKRKRKKNHNPTSKITNHC